MEIQPQCNRINSAVFKKRKIKPSRKQKVPMNFKIRSNSSNTLNN